MKRLAFGLAVGLLAAEGALRLASVIAARARLTADSSKRRVLCEGDSWTWGVGGRSYPTALQDRLGERWQVVNAGVPGRNSAQVARDLPEHLRALRPRVVILLAGANDDWNREGVDLSEDEASAKLDRMLLHLRLYKLVRLALRKPPADDSAVPDDDAIAALEASLARDPRAQAERLLLGWRYLHRDGLSKAAQVWSAGLALDPKSEQLYLQMGDAFNVSGDLDGAVGWWRRGLKALPGSQEIRLAMGEAYLARGRTGDALRVWRSLPGSPRLRRRLEKYRSGDVPADATAEARARRRREQAIFEACSAAREAGARVLVADYPKGSHPELERAARRAGAEFVPLGAMFAARFKSRAEWVGFDGSHCNSRGYAAMADIFAGLIEKP